MFKKNLTFLIAVLFISEASYSQSIKGGQFEFGFSNGLTKEWYFNQTTRRTPLNLNSKPFSSDTLFLDKDLNSDGIPDIYWFLKLNTWRTKENADDNLSDLALLTVPFTAGNGKTYDGSDIEIYQQFPNTMQVVSDLNSFATKKIDEVNVFYRYSKVVPQNTSVRSATSQPLLLQAPANFKDIKNRTAVIQVLFVTKIAYYKSCENLKQSDYFFYPCEKDDFSPALKTKKSWIVAGDNCNIESQIQESAIKSSLINWGNEKVLSKVIIEVVLKW